jgi:HAMP domain-containing protein
MLVVVVLVGALLVIQRVADRAADASLARELTAAEAAITDRLEARGNQLRAVAERLVQVPTYVARVGGAIESGDRATLVDAANELRDQIGADWALLTDPQGILQSWSDRPDQHGEDMSPGSLVAQALAGHTALGAWVEPSPRGDLVYQAAAVPLGTPGTPPLGVLVAALPVDSALADTLRRVTGSEILIFARDTLDRPQVRAATIAESAGLVEAIGRDTALQRLDLETGGGEWVGAIATMRTAAGTPVGGIVGLRSRQAELAPYLRVQRVIWGVLAVGLVLALISSALMARGITRPVRQLVSVTRRMATGDYSGTVPTTRRDELGELGRAFDQLQGELREKERLVSYLSAPRNGPSTGEDGAPLENGRILAGRYEIVAHLGSGGMGSVYRARDRELNETIALKVLHADLARVAPSVVDRFKQEIRLARRITHRNVVRTHDLGEDQGLLFITMEYVEGTPLNELIASKGRLPVDVTLGIGKQLCRALRVAHETGVIHRDIKPANLAMDPSGFLKVMDFGIARLADAPSQPGITVAGAVVGTPDYMAPEQLLGESIDGRTDLYAAGAVLYECATGEGPFNAPTLTGHIARRLERPPPDPRAVEPTVPESLALVIRTALAPSPDDRWPDAGAMLTALEGLASEVAGVRSKV